MHLSRRSVISALPASLVLLALLAVQPPPAGTVVKVSLWDKGEASMDAMDMAPMGMAMAGANMDMATMGITVDRPKIPAGEVTFTVINDFPEFYHASRLRRSPIRRSRCPIWTTRGWSTRPPRASSHGGRS